MSLTTPTATPTATHLLSLTTPYIPPFDCRFEIEKTLTSVVGDKIELVPYILSDPSDARFTACQPSGWESVVPESRFSFSPAVCPRGWTAYNIGVTEQSDQPVTTAWCCDADYYLYASNDYPLDGFSKPCSKTIPIGSVSLSFHLPWHVSWQASDLTSLTPTPPVVKAGQTIASWVPLWSPPRTTTSSYYTDYTDRVEGPDVMPLVLGLTLGLGVGLIFVVGICCFCCVSHNRREKVRQPIAATPP